MKDYSKMSDIEINQLVYASINEIGDVYPKDLAGKVFELLAEQPDYCNNPSDALPVTLENCIAITPCMGCAHGDATGYFEHKNPITVEFKSNDKALRAAMIVYLMMKDGEK